MSSSPDPAAIVPDVDESVSIDLSDLFAPDAPADAGEALDKLFSDLEASSKPSFGGAASPDADPFAALDAAADPDVSGGTAPIMRAPSISWDGADPWEAIGIAAPGPEDAVRLLGVLIRSMITRGLLDVREVADALVPPVEPPKA